MRGVDGGNGSNIDVRARRTHERTNEEGETTWEDGWNLSDWYRRVSCDVAVRAERLTTVFVDAELEIKGDDDEQTAAEMPGRELGVRNGARERANVEGENARDAATATSVRDFQRLTRTVLGRRLSPITC